MLFLTKNTRFTIIHLYICLSSTMTEMLIKLHSLIAIIVFIEAAVLF